MAKIKEENNEEKNTGTKLSEYDKNTENPFLKKAVEIVQKNIVKKYKSATNTGEKAILMAVDADGEVLGHTQFIRQIEVDDQQFAKVYLSGFENFFELKPQAIKVFGYILTQLSINKDEFIFDREDCAKYTSYKSDKSIFIGLASLLKNEIIARGKTDYRYYINPLVVFNGNRLSLTKTYVRKKKLEQDALNTNQLDLLTEIGKIKLEQERINNNEK